MADITAPMIAPARARPPPVSSPGDLLIRRTADTPTQKAAGPRNIPNGQTSTTPAIARTSAKTARPSATGDGAIVGDTWIWPTGWTLVRHMALPRPAVAAAAAAPTTIKATNAAGAGRYVPQVHEKAIETSRSAASRTPPATKSAPVTVTAGCPRRPIWRPESWRAGGHSRPAPSHVRTWARGGRPLPFGARL